MTLTSVSVSMVCSLTSKSSACSLPCVPYLATQQWYAEWLRRRLQGDSEAEARIAASSACQLRSRDFTHCVLPSSSGEIRLSVSVEGGSGMLKCLRPEDVRMSGHGRWPSVHLGALNALYGRSAYFEHLHDSLIVAYTDVEGHLLSELCNRLHDLQTALAFPRDMLHTLSALSTVEKVRLQEICSEYAHVYRSELPFLELIMRYGPDAIFVLLSTFYLKVDEI
ncbi:MAG: WbqC family protein [Muribaculaceae bacterium]|nr:WbqC family protein [Muribaculaceae bacterium]